MKSKSCHNSFHALHNTHHHPVYEEAMGKEEGSITYPIPIVGLQKDSADGTNGRADEIMYTINHGG
ncbi:hypothetical protein M5K25_022246 [Dendrobium thyrsiflorum]|uniref:Uncharacterized protein n=1 Tax=Dendrobium thyrsiflorum TaxID=117978 RepID=A0ABD0U5S1_DENTH